tara:strand:+ start:125 stop:304 length:180 start_codon:yes stop_codon:yes gene_type:complete
LKRGIKDQSGISPEVALRLSKALGRSPERWLIMQDNYDLSIAKKQIKLTNVISLDISAA